MARPAQTPSESVNALHCSGDGHRDRLGLDRHRLRKAQVRHQAHVVTAPHVCRQPSVPIELALGLHLEHRRAAQGGVVPDVIDGGVAAAVVGGEGRLARGLRGLGAR